MTTYSEEEVQKLLQEQAQRIEAAHFEEKTQEVLAEINRRLNESNGYKATIGRDVKEVRDKLIILEPLIAGHVADPIHAEAKKRFELQDKIEAQFTEEEKSNAVQTWRRIIDEFEAEDKSTQTKAVHRMWWQDWWVRGGITCAIVTQILQVLHLAKVF